MVTRAATKIKTGQRWWSTLNGTDDCLSLATQRLRKNFFSSSIAPSQASTTTSANFFAPIGPDQSHSPTNTSSGATWKRPQGWGRLVARADTSPRPRRNTTTPTTNSRIPEGQPTLGEEPKPRSITRLSCVSHQAPFRWIPRLLKPHNGDDENSKATTRAAVCTMAHYGGGIVSGDVLTCQIHVQPSAALALLGQGPQRIYSSSPTSSSSTSSSSSSSSLHHFKKSRIEMQVTVDADGFLVLGADPLVLHRQARHEQTQEIRLHPTASLCWVDLVGAGRIHARPPHGSNHNTTEGQEQWQQDFLANQTTLYIHPDISTASTPTATTSSSVTAGSTINNTGDHHRPNQPHDNVPPVLVDCTCLSRQGDLSPASGTQYGMEWTSGGSIRAYGSMILYGDQVREVMQRCVHLQRQLVSMYTGLRLPSPASSSSSSPLLGSSALGDHGVEPNHEEIKSLLQDSCSGRILMSVTEVPVPGSEAWSNGAPSASPSKSSISSSPSVAFLVRWAAHSQEDLYRIAHYCLLPLSTSSSSPFGGGLVEFYKERIRASRTARLPPSYATFLQSLHHPRSEDNSLKSAAKNNVASDHRHLPSIQSSSARPESIWLSSMLTDTALPTGSFSHSAGLEAAHQLKLLADDLVDVGRPREFFLQSYVQASTRSTLQQATPWVTASHQLATTYTSNNSITSSNQEQLLSFIQKWTALDRWVHAHLVTNGPACRASLDQGRSLVRVALNLVDHFPSPLATLSDGNNDATLPRQSTTLLLRALQQELDRSPNTGHMAGVFGVVSALCSLSSDHACQLLGYCVARDVVSAAVRMNLIGPLAGTSLLASAQLWTGEGMAVGRTLGGWSASGAPVLDTIQPCHELLSSRLFRS